MAVGDYEEVLKHYELRETVGTGRPRPSAPAGACRLSAAPVFAWGWVNRHCGAHGPRFTGVL